MTLCACLGRGGTKGRHLVWESIALTWLPPLCRYGPIFFLKRSVLESMGLAPPAKKGRKGARSSSSSGSDSGSGSDSEGDGEHKRKEKKRGGRPVVRAEGEDGDSDVDINLTQVYKKEIKVCSNFRQPVAEQLCVRWAVTKSSSLHARVC